MKEKNRPALAWLWQVTGREKWILLVLTVLQAVGGGCGVATAWLMRGIIDGAVAGNRNRFWLYAGGLVALTVGELLLRAAIRTLTEYSKAGLENRLKDRLFTTLLHKDYGTVTATHSGEWLNRLTSDTVVVAEGITSILPGLTEMAVRLIGALALLFYLLPLSGAIILPGGILLAVFSFSFRKVLKRLHKRIQEADGQLRIFLSDRISNLLIVRSFAREKASEQEAGEKMQEHKNRRMKRILFSSVCNLGFGAVMRGSYVFGAIYCGYGILRGTMSYGTFTAVVQLIGQIQAPFANITGYLPRYYSMLASAERLMEAEAFPDDGTEDALTQEEIHSAYQERFRGIRLKDVSFTYRPPVQEAGEISMPVVLSGINVALEKGELMAITGPSGCGKSTLLKLLMCLYPLDSGTRELMLADGVQPLTARWRGLFAYVPQGNQLLSGTIREIVAFCDREKMEQEDAIWQALRLADAEGFVRELSAGLDTQLGERGAGLSEGQIQRLAIARALLSDRPVLLLDEATSSLDEAAEAAVLRNLRQLTDRTVLIVTHRRKVLSVCTKELNMSAEGIQITELTPED